MEFSLVRSILRILLSIIFTSVLLPSVESAFLSRDGGYDLVLAIDDNTPAPEDIQTYTNNIQTAFQLFTMDLWRSTRRRFFINSVDLLLPSSWDTPTDIATYQAYETADFKISNEFEAPRVENPNPCGATGHFIELPSEFFNNSRLVKNYGESAKALLNLFARYRYGVWEEHGEIENEKFPYFYMTTSLTPKWAATGCSADIQGSILNEFGEESDDCNDRSLAGPSTNCRFVPSSTNNVNSSLSYLPWANSVNLFCDHKTHNYGAPNRQNLYCGHRSIWDVIVETEDYWTATSMPSDRLKVPNFRVLKASSRPLFYLLLDRGRTSTSMNVLREVQESLQGFLNSTLNPDTIAAVGTFPNVNTGRDHFYVKEEAPWSRVGSDEGQYSSVIQEAIGHRDGPVVRDFGEAIKEVVERIKTRNHKAGAVILIVKRGATKYGFEHVSYFGDVLSSLIEQSNIRLFGIEYQQSEKIPYVNLQPLIAQAGGTLHVVNGTTDVKAKLGPILNDVKEAIDQPSNEAENRAWTIFKGFATPETPAQITVLDESLESMTICITTRRYIQQSDVEIKQRAGSEAPTQITARNEWNEVADPSKRYVTIVKITNPPKDGIWEVRINKCNSPIPEECLAFVIANVELGAQVSAEESLSNNLRINVHTSAENNYLDYDLKMAKIVPFAIFARVELQGQRVLGLEEVTATIVYENREISNIPLKDDGSGLPDVSSNDGIYSGVFTPLEDGLYKIHVSITHHHRVLNEIVDNEEDKNATVNSLGRLISIDQGRFGCKGSSNRRCLPAALSRSVARTSDMTGTIYVAHTITFKSTPMKILDFTVTTLPGFKVRFGFTAPGMLGTSDPPEEYHIFMAPKIDNFLGGTDLTQLIIKQVGFPPGSWVEMDYPAMQQAVPFYAVEAVYGNQRGGPSNVVGVVTSADGSPPTPQPTTTTKFTSTTTTEAASPTSTTRTEGPSSTTTASPSPTSEEDPTSSPTTSTPSSANSYLNSPQLISAIFYTFFSYVFFKYSS